MTCMDYVKFCVSCSFLYVVNHVPHADVFVAGEKRQHSHECSKVHVDDFFRNSEGHCDIHYTLLFCFIVGVLELS
jgi:hypothetical protein